MFLIKTIQLVQKGHLWGCISVNVFSAYIIHTIFHRYQTVLTLAIDVKSNSQSCLLFSQQKNFIVVFRRFVQYLLIFVIFVLPFESIKLFKLPVCSLSLNSNNLAHRKSSCRIVFTKLKFCAKLIYTIFQKFQILLGLANDVNRNLQPC